MDALAVIALIGGILLVAGLFGGITTIYLNIPPLPKNIRILSSVVGMTLIIVVVWHISSSPTANPTSTNKPDIPPSTNKPDTQPPDEPAASAISVWAIDEDGFRVDIDTSGVYRVAYLGEAYSPWPNEQYPGYRGWTNIVKIYVNRSVEWGQTDYGLIGPINEDDYLGPGGYHLDKNQAIASATGDSRTFRLNAGDYLILVPLDEKGRYSDNQGKVDIEVAYLGQ